MKIERFLIFALTALLGIFLFISFQGDMPKDLSCIRIPVSFFPLNDRPTMEIEIEGKNYSVLIDLGCSPPLSLRNKYIEQIQKKESIELPDFMGIKGNRYHTQGTRVTEVKILSATLKDVIISEDSLDFFLDGNIWPSSGILDRFKDKLELVTINGRMGWSVFREACSLFDFPNSELVLAKDMDALIHGIGYSLEDFTSIPFEVETYGVVLSVATDLGTKKVMLDTGATHSILRESVVGQNSVAICAGRKSYVTRQLRLGEHDLGSWQFWLLEFSDFFKCDGILGVDFFKKYAVCLDFQTKIAYIKRRPTIQDKFTCGVNAMRKRMFLHLKGSEKPLSNIEGSNSY